MEGRRVSAPLAIVALVAVAAVGWAGFRYASLRSAPQTAPASTGEKLTFDSSALHRRASFSMRDLDGRTISSDSLRGKVTIINFWATWCRHAAGNPRPDCAAGEVSRQVQVIGVSQDEVGPDAVRQFASERHMNYRSSCRHRSSRRSSPASTRCPRRLSWIGRSRSSRNTSGC